VDPSPGKAHESWVLSKTDTDRISRKQHADQCCPNLSLNRVGKGAHEGLDLWSLLDRVVLNWLGGEDKPGRKLLLAVQEGLVIIEPAAAALAAAHATGERPDSVDGWFEDILANHAATARAIEEGEAEECRQAMEQVLGFNRSKLYRRKAGASRRNGRPGSSRSLRKK
jgi:hypothetical protein